MRKNRLILILTALLIGTACLHAQKVLDSQIVKAVYASQARAKNIKAAGTNQQGVAATLKYEKIADMKAEYHHHQTFPSGKGFVVVGGYDKALEHTRSAELYENGKWTSLTLTGAEAPTFSTILADGRVMIGGGAPSGAGTGQAKSTAIYDPSTHTFTKGPDMTVARSQCSGILIGNKIYVSGNWCEDDNVFDRYDGSKFQAVGQTVGRCKPYLFSDAKGSLYTLSANDNNYQPVSNRTYEGKEYFPGIRYDASLDKAHYYLFPTFVEYHPLEQPYEMRTTDYRIPSLNGYIILAKNDAGAHLLTIIYPDEGFNSIMGNVEIPTAHPVSGNTITWRGGAYWNEIRNEFYLIGSSGKDGNYSIHIISAHLDGTEVDAWSHATADGFDTDLTTASWTLFSDGRLACTGGISRSTYYPVSTAYIFTPPIAGTDGTETGPDNPDPGPDNPDPGPDNPDPHPGAGNVALFILTKDGAHHKFVLEGSRPQVVFEGTSLKVITSSAAETTFALSDIIRFTYDGHEPSGIYDLTVDKNPTEVDYQDGVLIISQLKEGATVDVYGLDGKQVKQLIAVRAGTYRLSLSALPKGVYIVKADKISYKIMKR